MKRIITTTVALLFPGFLLAGEPQTVKMKIEGMTCGMCEAKVKKQLSSLCKEITVDREKGEGVCKFESPITAGQVIQEANKTGYKTSELKN